MLLESDYREVCWKLDQRGAVGETPLHICMLNALTICSDLAKQLVRIYPKIVNDIYTCKEFYGWCDAAGHHINFKLTLLAQ